MKKKHFSLFLSDSPGFPVPQILNLSPGIHEDFMIDSLASFPKRVKGVSLFRISSVFYSIFNGLFESCELGLVRRLKSSRLWRMGSCRLWPLILEQKYNPQRRAAPHQSKKQPPMRFLQRFLVSFKTHNDFNAVKAL